MLGVASAAVAQDVVTAEVYFSAVAESYASIADYEARFEFRNGEAVSVGAISYKHPNMLRLDFEEPVGQVLVSDGQLLTVYYPRLEVIFEQTLTYRRQPGGADLASREGLLALRENYAVAYLVGPEPAALDDQNAELVTKLRLTSRNTTEGYRQLELAITADSLIRRITGITLNLEERVFQFADIRTNQDIPDARFDYDSPPDANVYTDFLFEEQP
jgi:outer membrane lipoprotein-sorting protein